MIAKVFKSGNSYALRLPRELHPEAGTVHIESQGERWIVTPTKAKEWSADFFDTIQITNEAFSRPEQGNHRSFNP